MGEKRRTNDSLSEKEIVNPLSDDRFASMFSNRDFEVDVESEEYKLLNPVVSKREKERRQQEEHMDSLYNDVDLESSDEEMDNEKKNSKKKDIKIYSMNTENFNRNIKTKKKKSESLGDILSNQKETDKSIVKESGTVLGQREMTFLLDKPKRDGKREAEM